MDRLETQVELQQASGTMSKTSSRSTRSPRSRIDKNGEYGRNAQQKEEFSRMRILLNKLTVLLFTDIIIAMICGAVVVQETAYFAGALDMLVSNICLWLSYSFNDKYYGKICFPCDYACNRRLACAKIFK